MPQRRKRSAAITLVLAGSLGGCSEPVPQRDVYTSLAAGILNAACMTY